MEEKEVILTQEGYNKLEEELNYLKTEKRTIRFTKPPSLRTSELWSKMRQKDFLTKTL